MINIIAEVELLFDEIACGKVIFMRTDTIYGLIADSRNIDAINGIYHIKNRSKDKTLPLFFPSIQMIREYAVIPDTIDLFMRHFLPGAITVILKLKEGVALHNSLYDNKTRTIAARIPLDDTIREAARRSGAPLTGTSANVSDMQNVRSIDDFIQQIKLLQNNELLQYVNSHLSYYAKERAHKMLHTQQMQHSTIISFDITKKLIYIHREGAVTNNQLRGFLQKESSYHDWDVVQKYSK